MVIQPVGSLQEETSRSQRDDSFEQGQSVWIAPAITFLLLELIWHQDERKEILGTIMKIKSTSVFTDLNTGANHVIQKRLPKS